MSSSDEDEELQTGTKGDAVPLLTSLLADVPIQNATVGMLAEALAKVLQVQSQATRPGAARSKRKTHEPPVESFTDAQRRTNKVSYFPTAVDATKNVSGQCSGAILHVIPFRER